MSSLTQRRKTAGDDAEDDDVPIMTTEEQEAEIAYCEAEMKASAMRWRRTMAFCCALSGVGLGPYIHVQRPELSMDQVVATVLAGVGSLLIAGLLLVSASRRRRILFAAVVAVVWAPLLGLSAAAAGRQDGGATTDEPMVVLQMGLLAFFTVLVEYLERTEKTSEAYLKDLKDSVYDFKSA